MKFTAQELADQLAVERPSADGLLRFLLDKKLAKYRGERPSPSGRGKGAHVYEIEHGAGDAVARIIKEAES
jgi:predicted ArsR family transcriptional regulator